MAPGEWLGIIRGLGKMTFELTDDCLGMIREIDGHLPKSIRFQFVIVVHEGDEVPHSQFGGAVGRPGVVRNDGRTCHCC